MHLRFTITTGLRNLIHRQRETWEYSTYCCAPSNPSLIRSILSNSIQETSSISTRKHDAVFKRALVFVPYSMAARSTIHWADKWWKNCSNAYIDRRKGWKRKRRVFDESFALAFIRRKSRKIESVTWNEGIWSLLANQCVFLQERKRSEIILSSRENKVRSDRGKCTWIIQLHRRTTVFNPNQSEIVSTWILFITKNLYQKSNNGKIFLVPRPIFSPFWKIPFDLF